MCGRFTQYSAIEVLEQTFGIEKVTCTAAPSYNIAPTRKILAVIQREEKRLGRLRWGFVPSWARDFSGSLPMINARLETAFEKPFFKAAFSRRRCLIPADGFFEWQREGKEKKPWYFTLPGGGPMMFAGIFETWKGESGDARHTCAILTTGAGPQVAPVHGRMPLIIARELADPWLDPSLGDPARVMEIARLARVWELAARPVSPLVNNATNDQPACIEGISDQSENKL